VAGRIASEIKQSKPFDSLEQEAFLNLVRTADALTQFIQEALKPYDLSASQYNVLRILRGAGEAGLACGEIAGRMVAHDPDMTRMLDRLEKRGLVMRARGRKDRRVVMTQATPAALALLKSLDRPLRAAHERMLSHLGAARLRQLIELLEAARKNTPTEEEKETSTT
jgi:DNA-binding MarR family transcriptional regulator